MSPKDPVETLARELFDRALERLDQPALGENASFRAGEESTSNFQIFELVKEDCAPLRFTFADGLQVAVGSIGEVADVPASSFGDPGHGVVSTALAFLTCSVRVRFTHRDKRVLVELRGPDGAVRDRAQHRSLWRAYRVEPERLMEYPPAFRNREQQ